MHPNRVVQENIEIEGIEVAEGGTFLPALKSWGTRMEPEEGRWRRNQRES